MPLFKVPYQFITELPQRAVQQLQRDFQEIERALNARAGGVVMREEITSSVVLNTSPTDLGLSFDFEILPGRRYRLYAHFGVSASAEASGFPGMVTGRLYVDSDVVDKSDFYTNTLYLSNTSNMHLEYVTTDALTPGTYTFSTDAEYKDAEFGGSVTASATRPAYLVLEDIGAA